MRLPPAYCGLFLFALVLAAGFGGAQVFGDPDTGWHLAAGDLIVREAGGIVRSAVFEALVFPELVLHVGRGLVDRRDDRAGRGIRLLAGVEADGAETRAGCELHDPTTIT